jgi:hypothetical protein
MTTTTLGTDTILRLTVNQHLIAPNNSENSAWHSQQGMSGFRNKAPCCFSFSLFFFFPLPSPNKQKARHQSE